MAAGLRSIFFLLADLVVKFRFLKVGLPAVLVFLGFKMSIVELYEIPPLVTLVVILGILATAVLASLMIRPSTTSPAKLESLLHALRDG